MEKSVILQRHSQTVHRKSECTGEIISRGVEEVEFPRARVSVTSDGVGRSESSRSHAFNRTTCTGTGTWNALGNLFNFGREARIDFTVDIAETLLNVRVNEGLNYIDFDFFGDCPAGSESCEKEERSVLDRGTLVLDVSYEVKDLDAAGAPPKIIEEPCRED